MKRIEDIAYQLDVVSTLVDNGKEDYILWIDADDRMIETHKGINTQIADTYQVRKYCKIFGYPFDAVKTIIQG